MAVTRWSFILQHNRMFNLIPRMQYTLQRTVLGPLISNCAILSCGSDQCTICQLHRAWGDFPTLVKYKSSLTTCSHASVAKIISRWNHWLIHDYISLTVANEPLSLLLIIILRFSSWSFLLLDSYPVDFPLHCLWPRVPPPLSGLLQSLVRCFGPSHR